MNNPVIHAFFVGRALAQVLGEKVEDSVTQTLSEFGRFEAEQRENLRQFSEEVMARADRQAADYGYSGYSGTNTPPSGSGKATSTDLQETIDELRADIAQVRTALTNYRQQSA